MTHALAVVVRNTRNAAVQCIPGGVYIWRFLLPWGEPFFSWLLILRQVEGEPTEPIGPFMVGLIGFLGAVMGLKKLA